MVIEVTLKDGLKTALNSHTIWRVNELPALPQNEQGDVKEVGCEVVVVEAKDKMTSLQVEEAYTKVVKEWSSTFSKPWSLEEYKKAKASPKKKAVKKKTPAKKKVVKKKTPAKKKVTKKKAR